MPDGTSPRPGLADLGAPTIDWPSVRRVLVIRLRSIGDTVLSTPTLIALRRFLPNAEIDVLLEPWVAPVLEGFPHLTSVIPVHNGLPDRFRTARKIRRRAYDVVFNLHGGSTSSFMAFATGARFRIGYSNHRYLQFYTHLLSSSADFWQRPITHSAEQQLALAGFAGVPVDDRPRTSLAIKQDAAIDVESILSGYNIADRPLALIHPTTAFETKRWPARNFAELLSHLNAIGLYPVLVSTPAESEIIDDVCTYATQDFVHLPGLTLPQITALAARAQLFVGNDSGIAHIAAAVQTPTVVIFGSSNRAHWHPWTDAPNAIVFDPLPCQPCPGYRCEQFGEPRCILNIPTSKVIAEIEKVLAV
ncbi:MAG: glycosyltransferase family 9 protein [Blastocatellia bacterium]|nr:glycosyltransferase family 9 protein [Blastocatellia bacterium]